MQYNEFGDIIYSNLPLYNIKKIETITTGRYSAVEIYEYVYDKFNRWLEKYVVFENNRVLIEKRFYKCDKYQKNKSPRRSAIAMPLGTSGNL